MSLNLSSHAQTETPRQLGYTFPDEWEKHAGTMMICPAKHSYAGQTAGLRKEFRDLAIAIARNEPVHIFCMSSELKQCEETFQNHANIAIHPGQYRIDWARDNAPMVLRDNTGKLASAGFRCNGWGKKYPGWEKDVETRDNIARAMEWPIFPSDLVLEGGAIEIANRIGITTESCVLNPNRTNWSKEKVENELKAMLGLDKIIWLKSGLMPDDITDGHVDGLLKFVRKDTVLLHTTDLKSDVNYKICQEARKILLQAGLKVIELPLMDDIIHMNFYIGSGGRHHLSANLRQPKTRWPGHRNSEDPLPNGDPHHCCKNRQSRGRNPLLHPTNPSINRSRSTGDNESLYPVE